MEKQKETKLNNNEDETYRTIETTETTLEDGFVHQADINLVRPDNYGKYHKGYSKNKVLSTNDPRIIKPFINSMCALFFGIGIITLLINLILHNLILLIIGLAFIAISTFTFSKFKKEINNIEKELSKNPNYDSNDKKVMKEFKEDIKNNFNDISISVFTKEKMKAFVKLSLPIYCIISAIIFILISIVTNIFLGLIILILLILFGLIYFWIIFKICKK